MLPVPVITSSLRWIVKGHRRGYLTITAATPQIRSGSVYRPEAG